MGLPDIENIPETGAVFTIGRSRFAENVASHFFIRKDPVVSVTCGDEHSAVVCESGRLFVFGSNDWGQLGLGHKNHVSKPSCVKVLKPEKVTHVACGRAHTLICTTDQKIFACGSDQESQLGRGSHAVGDSSSSPVMIHDCGLAGLKLLQIAAGSHHSLALTSDGGVLAWGSNLEGQLGLPGTSGLVNTPTKVHIPEPVKQISAGYYHSAFLTESGKIYVCGEAESGKLGIAVDFRTQVAPKQMQLSRPAALVACGGHHTLILDEDGKIYCTGSNASGQLGMGTDVTEISTPELLPCDNLQGETIEKIGCGESHIAIVTDSGNLYTCGDCRHGKLGLEENDNNIHELTLAVRYQELVVTDVSCGGCHTILVGRRRDTDNNADDKHHQDHMIQQTKNSLPPLKMPAPRALNDNAVNDKPEEVPPDAENNIDETSHEASVEVTENAVNGTCDSITSIDKPEIPKQFSDYEKVPPETPSNSNQANEDGGGGHENNNGEATEPILDAENNVTGKVGEPETVKSPRSSGSGVSRVVVEERKKSAGGRKEEEESLEKPDSTPLPVEPPPKPPRQKISSAENSQSSRQGSSSSRLTSASSGKKKSDDSQAENLTGSAHEPGNSEEKAKEKKDGGKDEHEEKREGKDEDEEKGEGKHEDEGKAEGKDENEEKEERKDEKDDKEEKEQKAEENDEKEEKKEADPELPVDSEDIADVEEEKTKSDGESTKRSAGSEKSRSAKSKAGTDETVEADIQNGLDDIEDDNIPVETKKEIVADVVHSAAPRTAGKMSKLFKSKKQEVENGTKANGTSTKAKSKTCTML